MTYWDCMCLRICSMSWHKPRSGAQSGPLRPVPCTLHQLYIRRRQPRTRVPAQLELRLVVLAGHSRSERLRADSGLLRWLHSAVQSAGDSRSDVVRAQRTVLQSVRGAQLRRADARRWTEGTAANLTARSVLTRTRSYAYCTPTLLWCSLHVVPENIERTVSYAPWFIQRGVTVSRDNREVFTVQKVIRNMMGGGHSLNIKS